MKEKLRIYIEALFQDAPLTQKAVELKEEILQNICDKYDDLLMQGKTEEAAYNIAIAGIGDISGLIADLGKRPGAVPQAPVYSRDEIEKEKKRSALFTIAAVALYILCLVPAILFDELFHSDLGIIITFLMVAAASALIIYNNMTKKSYKRTEDSVVEEFREWNAANAQKKQVFKSLSGALWAVVVVVYFLVSFTTFAWDRTWIIFLIGAAIEAVMKAVLDLTRTR
ncbi:MAG: permease prefix domain 1-containing protein [Oscillospiraceae bacterium]|jgi:hypothetical protein|nr:permease prefix domain 1-containing protein [Oscillospiraceae bacterium]